MFIFTHIAKEIIAFHSEMVRSLDGEVCGVNVNTFHEFTSSFPFRGYLMFSPTMGDTELAFSVVLKHGGETIDVKSDLCLDNGSIISTGPSGVFNSRLGKAGLSDLNVWLDHYRIFVKDNLCDITSHLVPS